MAAAGTEMEVKEKTGFRRVMLLLLLGCSNIIVAINHTLPTFQGYTPHYFCQVDNVTASVEGCVDEPNTSDEMDEPSCPHGYEFESERGDWTIVTEWQLICERRAFKPLLATVYFCGVTLGAVICGMLADRYGRRPLVLTCLCIQGVLGLSLYFASSLGVFMGLRFAQGFFVQGVQGVSYTLAVELFPPRLRTVVGVVLEQYWAVGLVYLAAASYFIPYWRNLQLAISLPTTVIVLYIFIVPESARWLSSHGRPREAQKAWDRILPHKKNNKFLKEMESIRKSLISHDMRTQNEELVEETHNMKGSKVKENGSDTSKPVELEKLNNDITSNGKIEETELENNSSAELCKTGNVFNDTKTASNMSQSSVKDIHSGNCQSNDKIQRGELLSDEDNLENKNDGSAMHDSLSVIVTNKHGREKLDQVQRKSHPSAENVWSDGEISSGNIYAIINKNETDTKQEQAKARTGVLELFRSGVLRKYNLIMVYVWFSVSLSYYGIMFYLPDLSGERHLNFLLGAILEAVSYTIAYFILSRFGRRLPMTTFLLIGGIICILVGAASVVSEEDIKGIGYIQTALALIGKAAVVSGFCTMFLYTSELFPTVLRAAAMGHCGFWGRVGSLLAPQLLFLGEYTLSAVPLLIMGVLNLLGGILVLALPETQGRQLPDTVEEAEVLVSNKQQI